MPDPGYFPKARIVVDRFHVMRVIHYHFMHLAAPFQTLTASLED